MPSLADDSPHDWLWAHFDTAYASRHDPDGPPDGTWHVSLPALLRHDPNPLRAEFSRLRALDVPGPTAASYLVGWYAGSVAESVGIGLAAGRVGCALDPGTLRWEVHPSGWPLSLRADVRATVAVDHPWASRPDVEMVATPSDVARWAARSLVVAVTPIVDACHQLARVGRIGLWNEVADALGMVLAYQHDLETDADAIDVLAAAVNTPGVPWRARPRLWFVDAPPLGRLLVAQKGGCCLAYHEADADEPADEGELDDYHRQYLAAFPRAAAEPHYCTTCSLRDPDDCAARQVFWARHHAPGHRHGERLTEEQVTGPT
jgi:hypothetical protein